MIIRMNYVLYLLLGFAFNIFYKEVSGQKVSNNNNLFRWLPLRRIGSENLVAAVADTSVYERDSKHYSRLDACENETCNHVLRQANRLSRLKLVRRYVRDTVYTLDRLVTALDAELVGSAQDLKKAIGTGCRSAHAVLSDVLRDSFENEEKL